MNKSPLSLSRCLSLSLAGLFVFLPFWTLISTWLGSNLGHLYLWRLLPDILIFGLAFLALRLAVKNKQLWLWLKADWLPRWIYIYATLNIVLALWSFQAHQVTAYALIDGLVTDLSFLGLFLISFVAARRDKFLYDFWPRVFLGPAATAVVLGLCQKFLPVNFLSHFGYGPKTTLAYQTVDAHSGPVRLQSTLRGANPLGAYLVFVLPLWLAEAWKKWWRLGLGLAVGIAVLLMTYSRSALAAATFALAALIMWLATIKYRQLLLAVGVAIVLLISAGLYVDRNSQFVQENIFHTSSHSTSPKSSNQVRRQALRANITDALHHPLGRGPGTAGPASAHNQPRPARIAENYYVQIAQETGLIGLVTFLVINILMIRRLWFLRASNLAKALLVSMGGISLVNLVSHAWADQTLALLWWGLAGVCLGVGILKAKE